MIPNCKTCQHYGGEERLGYILCTCKLRKDTFNKGRFKEILRPIKCHYHEKKVGSY